MYYHKQIRKTMKNRFFTDRNKLKNDLIILAFFLIISAILIFLSKPKESSTADHALITIDGRQYATLPLNEDTVTDITTDAGTNRVKVSDKTVSVISADCPDKICVHHSPISLDGETIVCLPHRMVITVYSNKESDIDAVSQ